MSFQLHLVIHLDPHVDNEAAHEIMRELGKDIHKYYIEAVKATGEVVDAGTKSKSSSRTIQRRNSKQVRVKHRKVSKQVSSLTSSGKRRRTGKVKGA